MVSTTWPLSGFVLELVDVRLAACHAASPKAGAASGDSSAMRQTARERSGREMASAPGSGCTATTAPDAARRTATSAPFQLTRRTRAEAQIWSALGALVSP